MSDSSEEKQQLGRALGKIPSGVFILTARDGATRSAMLASWVQQASFEPPTIVVALAPDRPILQTIRAAGFFAISIVPNEDKSLMKHYARGVKPGDDAFAGVTTFDSPAGIPVLSDALAWLEARVVEIHPIGADHELLIGRVTAGNMLRDGAAFAHQRGSGFHY